MILTSPADLEKYRRDLSDRKTDLKMRVRVCAGTGCLAGGSKSVY